VRFQGRKPSASEAWSYRKRVGLASSTTFSSLAGTPPKDSQALNPSSAREWTGKPHKLELNLSSARESYESPSYS